MLRLQKLPTGKRPCCNCLRFARLGFKVCRHFAEQHPCQIVLHRKRCHRAAIEQANRLCIRRCLHSGFLRLVLPRRRCFLRRLCVLLRFDQQHQSLVRRRGFITVSGSSPNASAASSAHIAMVFMPSLLFAPSYDCVPSNIPLDITPCLTRFYESFIIDNKL